MESSHPVRVLVVTDQATAPPALIAAIRQRSQDGPAQFRVIVPNPAPAEWHVLHPTRHDKAAEAERVLAQALPAIEEAAGASVIASVSIRHNPMDVIEETLHDEPLDELILSIVPHGLAARLHNDLPDRLEHPGPAPHDRGRSAPATTPIAALLLLQWVTVSGVDG